MIVRYVGETRPLELTHGKEYEVRSVERGWYRIKTDRLGDYLYPAALFDVVKDPSVRMTRARERPGRP